MDDLEGNTTQVEDYAKPARLYNSTEHTKPWKQTKLSKREESSNFKGKLIKLRAKGKEKV